MQFYGVGTYGYKDAKSCEYQSLAEQGVLHRPRDQGDHLPCPYGFNPHLAGKEDDVQAKAGFRGAIAAWNWDLGTGYGEDRFAMYPINSANARSWLR